MRDSVERYGAGLVFLRHSDLHNGLCKHLEATEGHPVKINIETEITEVDCEAGILQMRDGSTVKKDLLVLANGLGVGVFAKFMRSTNVANSSKVSFP